MAPPQYRRSPTSQRSAEIRSAMKKKHEQIKEYTEKKEIAIITTSSINNAVRWVTSHPDWKKEMTDAERWKWLDDIGGLFIQFFQKKKPEYGLLYEELSIPLQEGEITKEEAAELTKGDIRKKKVDDFSIEIQGEEDTK